MTERIVYFDTERKAEQAKRKYKKYKSTRNWRWVVQGNSLVKIAKKRWKEEENEV